MRLVLAALAVTFTIAVTSSVFAIWPVVTDAPWEDDVPVTAIATPTFCENLYRLFEGANDPDIEKRVFEALGSGRCVFNN